MRASFPGARVDLQEVCEGEGAARRDDAAIQKVIAYQERAGMRQNATAILALLASL
jgi:hypothetical protein